jgi:hypothetical protein
VRGRKSENEKKIEQFADWLGIPEEERTIKTQKEFAEFLGIDEHTLVRWKVKLAETDTEDEIDKFKHHLYKQAMKSNATAKHMELYAKLKGLFDTPKTTTNKMTADDYIREGKELIRRQKVLYESSGVCPVCGFRAGT